MPETQTLALFALASLVLVVVPGPAVLYIVTRSVSQGRSAGVVSALGVNAGSMVHVLAAVLGVSLIVARSAVAFNAIKWAGVAYLAWLGIGMLRSKDDALLTETVSEASLRRVFLQGVVVNVLNPKLAVFFLAFLPQFVDADAANPTLQTFVLGLTLVVIGTLSDSVYALIGGHVGERLRSQPGFARRTRVGAGVTYIGLAGIAAIT